MFSFVHLPALDAVPWESENLDASGQRDMHHVIKITDFDRPMPTLRRQVGAMNVGLYCRCGEFIAFAITRGEPAVEYEFVADQPMPVACPFCGSKDHRRAEEITQLVLTEENLRQH
jgi:hypothetical protein